MSIDTMPAAQAVEALIADYGKLVFRVIFGLTGDWQESQDLTQETFFTAFKAIEAARQASGANFHAKAWLMQIAANTARMSLRRRSLVRFVPFASLRKEEQDERDGELVNERPAAVQPAGYGLGHVAGDPAELIAERDLVQRTMAQLPETLRLCLLLSIVGGLSSREVARALNLGEAAVRQRLSRARKLFQQIYLRESGDFIAAASTFSTQTQPRPGRRRSRLAHRSRLAMAAVS
jgi:RNA polymerase sigma factor (sigma-70 family)